MADQEIRLEQGKKPSSFTFLEMDSTVDAVGGQYDVISKQTIAGRGSQTIYFPRIAAYRFENDARRSVHSLSQLLHKINT